MKIYLIQEKSLECMNFYLIIFYFWYLFKADDDITFRIQENEKEKATFPHKGGGTRNHK